MGDLKGERKTRKKDVWKNRQRGDLKEEQERKKYGRIGRK